MGLRYMQQQSLGRQILQSVLELFVGICVKIKSNISFFHSLLLVGLDDNTIKITNGYILSN